MLLVRSHNWRTARTALDALGVAVVYLAGAQLGLLLTPRNQPVSLMWPPNALLLSILLLSPRRVWAWYALAVLPVHFGLQLGHGIPVATSIGWYFTNVGEAVLSAYLLRRWRPASELFETLTGVALFLSISVVGVAGLTSFLDAAVVILTQAGDGYWQMVERRFVSNALATLTIVPAFVMLGPARLTDLRKSSSTARVVEAATLGVGTLVVVALFLGMRTETRAAIPAVIYTVLPLLFWAAVRFGPPGVSLLLLIAVGAVLGVARDREPFSIQDVWALQMLLAMLSVLSLSLAVVIRESRRLQSLHSAVLRSIPDALAIVGETGVVIETNEAWARAARAHDPPPLLATGRYVNYLEYLGPEQQPCAGGAAMLKNGIEQILGGSRAYFEMEYSFRCGEETRWFVIAIAPLSGERAGGVISHADVTARKRADAETAHLRDELAHAGRVMTMGMLSASVTHELSQPLTAILGNAQAATRMLAKDNSEREQLQSILADITAATKRATSILRQLRSWFKNRGHMSELLRMNDVTHDVLTLLQGDILRRGISIDLRYATELPHVRGDRLQLQQVVLNLLLNACDAVRHLPPSRRRIVVSTAPDERGVLLCIEDNGTGFPQERLTSAFEPFVTTKPAGLGLGLALCRTIVEAHEGQLTAANNDGGGATVCLILPGADDIDEETGLTQDVRVAVSSR